MLSKGVAPIEEMDFSLRNAVSLHRTPIGVNDLGVEFTGPPKRMAWGAMATWFNDPDGNRFFRAEE